MLTMVLIQLLLPISGQTSAENQAKFSETRRELATSFNGLTAYLRSPAKGWWSGPDGRTDEDEVIMIEVVTDTFDRAWWQTYTARLAERFGQASIHLRAIAVDMLDQE